jgi:hypothetical protein
MTGRVDLRTTFSKAASVTFTGSFIINSYSLQFNLM